MMKLVWILSTLLVAAGCSSVKSERSEGRRDIDVGTHRLEVCLEGKRRGFPPVVIESGLSAEIDDWTRVRTILAEKTQVICYNRAGVGGSQSGPEPRRASAIALELRAVLQALKVEPPVILVGHSIGGIYVRRFAAMYPEEVCGIVLIDPTMEFLQPLSWARIEPELRERWPDDYDRIESLLRRIHPKMSPMAAQSILELEPYFEQLSPELRPHERAKWLDLIVKHAQHLEGMLTVLTRAECQELFATADSMDLVRDKVIQVPLLLLAAGKTGSTSELDNEAMTSDYFLWANELRMDRYTDFVSSQSRGRLRIVPDAGHNIHRERPEVVATAIEELLHMGVAERTE